MLFCWVRCIKDETKHWIDKHNHPKQLQSVTKDYACFGSPLHACFAQISWMHARVHATQIINSHSHIQLFQRLLFIVRRLLRCHIDSWNYNRRTIHFFLYLFRMLLFCYSFRKEREREKSNSVLFVFHWALVYGNVFCYGRIYNMRKNSSFIILNVVKHVL